MSLVAFLPFCLSAFHHLSYFQTFFIFTSFITPYLTCQLPSNFLSPHYHCFTDSNCSQSQSSRINFCHSQPFFSLSASFSLPIIFFSNFTRKCVSLTFGCHWKGLIASNNSLSISIIQLFPKWASSPSCPSPSPVSWPFLLPVTSLSVPSFYTAAGTVRLSAPLLEHLASAEFNYSCPADIAACSFKQASPHCTSS